eukprot:CAMPEP_0117667046 /NCGR_PEP_ID=MMETSP0804-20121206/10736_1 /TAXON_ID=1074897 /ORGANISM="Tetraselmis astigmatica, Strain CCMP880" /LENGTH=226 /DNA_ID=CAMNT_0005474703 /DNA_START=59 /DNA_END=739 /DNA_ORIENTATION=+
MQPAVTCPTCTVELERPEEFTCPSCGSLEGHDLTPRRGGEGHQQQNRVFSYDWASGYIAPFRAADPATVHQAVQQAASALQECHSLKPSRVIDLGCGNGAALMQACLLLGVPGWEADLDEELLAIAADSAKQARADIFVEQADILSIPPERFGEGAVVFCYLLPAGLQKMAAALRCAVANQRCAVVTVTWAAPGLEGLLAEGPSGAGFHVYCRCQGTNVQLPGSKR